MRRGRFARIHVLMFVSATCLMLSAPARADLANDCATTLLGDPLCQVYSVHPEVLSPEVQAGLQAEAAELAATPLGNLPDDLSPIDPAPIASGLFSGDETGTPPVPVEIFTRDATAWTGTPAMGDLTSVWAGASTQAPTLGMVVAATYDSAGLLLTAKAITAPSPHGSLTISNAPLGSTLLMTAADGTTWVFDPTVGHIVGT